MADDTRQSPKEDLSREALTVSPEQKPFAGSQWQDGKAQPYKPGENANAFAEGGSQHTAGGQVPDVTMWNALTVGQPITEIHKRPCVRDGLMTGIGAGFATGGVRLIFGGGTWKSCNWAVGAWAAGSAIMYQYCLHRRQAEKEGMTRAMEILNRKEVERKAREQRKEKMREERRAAKEEEQDEKLRQLKAKSEGGKSWWKVW
ncbi:related to COX20 In the maturation and assembly of cytochrome oxidase involved [Lecanosticta acicola]|uniref:Cytochrome c oxidase assembly protein COX20, mitochondrial n=1 Tax=Lecanosticta acicola TaxID=111012 RepID=A0AAI9EEL3_9PEZI|nr:related to COX20 In the maturation and assembly of cytochrome oxidase involved [Lecanosticta acicola]